MPIKWSGECFRFPDVEKKAIAAGCDGRVMESDGGMLLLGQAERALRMTQRLAECFTDRRDLRLFELTVMTLIRQRVFGIGLGYEDRNDHDELRHGPVPATHVGKLKVNRSDCAPVAGIDPEPVGATSGQTGARSQVRA